MASWEPAVKFVCFTLHLVHRFDLRSLSLAGTASNGGSWEVLWHEVSYLTGTVWVTIPLVGNSETFACLTEAIRPFGFCPERESSLPDSHSRNSICNCLNISFWGLVYVPRVDTAELFSLDVKGGGNSVFRLAEWAEGLKADLVSSNFWLLPW